MVLQGKLNHMVHVNCEVEQEFDIFKEHAEYTYRVDFATRLLYFRPVYSDIGDALDWDEGEGWIHIPFIALDNDALKIFDDCRLPKNIERTLQYLKDGPKMLLARQSQSSNMCEEGRTN